jgi:hypothetical protein
MALVDFALVKKHLRVFHDDDDDTIAAYQAAAENIVVEYLDREIVPTGGAVEGDAIEVTPAITAAVLLVTGDLYEVREPDQKQEGAMLPRAVRALLAPYRVWRTHDPDMVS